jgi:hypothetical protein
VTRRIKTAPSYWILQGKLAVPVDLMTWARWFESAGDSRLVAKTRIGGVEISTIFIGLDHNFFEDGEPEIFETMVFRGGSGQECDRCGTWEGAEGMHTNAVALVRAEIKDKVNE